MDKMIRIIEGICLVALLSFGNNLSIYADVQTEQNNQSQINNQSQSSSTTNNQSSNINNNASSYRKQPFHVPAGTHYYGHEGYYKQFSFQDSKQNNSKQTDSAASTTSSSSAGTSSSTK